MLESTPLAKIRSRKSNPVLEKKAVAQGLHPVLAKIIARRNLPKDLDPIDIINPKLSQLSNPDKLADSDKAADRVAMAIINVECIGLETDHDCDGQTSHAVLHHCLVKHFKHPKAKIRSYIGHRLKEGYGLSESVARRILQDSPKVNLLITADNGSTDEPRIKLLADEGIDVIVTDHHQIPKEGIPKSAYACLNPTRDDCSFSDPYIAGCMVAWLLMVKVRQKLIQYKFLTKDAPKLQDSLDFVALGTIADCVSMVQSKNNRIVVAYGMQLIQKGVKPCWQALQPILTETGICSEDLSFKIAPLLNSDGRLACAFGSVSLLLAENVEEALSWVESLAEQNQERKAIQKQITTKGIDSALKSINKSSGNLHSLTIFLEDGHVGVQGISASRIKDLFGLPTAFLAPKLSDKTYVSGSLRGIDNNFNVRTALQFIEDSSPGLLVAFGGHRGAGGVTLERKNLALFADLFEAGCKEQLAKEILEPVVLSDGEIECENINLEFVQILKRLEPFGREFEQPIFHISAKLANIYPMGDGSHYRLSLKIENRYFKAVWFNAKDKGTGLQAGDAIKVAFSLTINTFRGKSNCEMLVASAEKLA